MILSLTKFKKIQTIIPLLIGFSLSLASSSTAPSIAIGIMVAVHIHNLEMALWQIIVVSLVFNLYRFQYPITGLEIPSSFFIFAIGLLQVGIFFKSNKMEGPRSNFIKPTVYAVVSSYLLLGVYGRIKEENALNLLVRGYDNLGHFAIWNALNEHSGFLSKLKDQSSVPETYLMYPQQWHILFSNFANSSVSDYLAAHIATIVICACLLFASYERLLISQEKNVAHKKNMNLFTPNALFLCALFLIISMWGLGYPNYVLAISLLIAGIVQVRTNEDSNFSKTFIGYVTMFMSGQFYTLLIPGISLYIFIDLVWSKKVWKINSIKESIIYAAFLLLTILNAFWFLFVSIENKQFDAISEQSGSWNLTVIGTAFLGLVIKELKINSIGRSQKVLVHSLFFELVCIQGLLFYRNEIGGYFYFKLFIAVSILVIFLQIQTFKTVKISRRSGRPEKKLRKLPIEKDARRTTINNSNGMALRLGVFFLLLNLAFSFLTFIGTPSPLKGYLSSLSALTKSNAHLESLQEIAEQTINDQIVISSPNYFTDSQILGSISGNWSQELQDFLNMIAKDRGIIGTLTTDEVDQASSKGLKVVFLNE